MSTAPTERTAPTADATINSDAQSMMVPVSPTSAGVRPADHQLGILGALIDNQAWNRMVKIAETFSRSDLVPKHFQGKMANCIIALQCAIRMQVDPFMLMQNMYIVHGKPGIEAKFAIAMANAKRVFRGPIRFLLSGEGMKRQCTAVAIDRETGERLEETVTMEMARREGWIDKEGSKWKSIPDLMLKYRSAMWLIRTTCPEVLMGMQTTDELVDIAREPIESQARYVDSRSPSDQLADMLESQVAEAASDSQTVVPHAVVVTEPVAPPERRPTAADPESTATESPRESHPNPVSLDTEPPRSRRSTPSVRERPTSTSRASRSCLRRRASHARGRRGIQQNASAFGPGQYEAAMRLGSGGRRRAEASAEDHSDEADVALVFQHKPTCVAREEHTAARHGETPPVQPMNDTARRTTVTARCSLLGGTNRSVSLLVIAVLRIG
jgi:hypothetical protein